MMKGLLATLALAAVSLASPTNQAPDSFKIKNVVYGGSGCPQGSIDVDWTENGILPICEPWLDCIIFILILNAYRLWQAIHCPRRSRQRSRRIAKKLPDQPQPRFQPRLLLCYL